MFCVSLHFNNADLSVREQFPYGAEILDDLEQGVFLSTCNRVEVYGAGDLYGFVDRYFHAFKSRVFLYEGKAACRHLFRVATGLDSMVLGEDEILGQVKNAFAAAQDAGHTDYELNTVFRAAVTAAKKVKTETLLSKSSVSVATLAASAIVRHREELLSRRPAGERDDPVRVVVIGGSGDTGKKVLKDLLSYEVFDITATVRTHGIRDRVTLIDYRERYPALAAADVIVSATKNPQFTVTAEQLAEAEAGAPKERLYVDLASPRDIDPDLSPVITLDDIEALATRNNERRQNAARAAEDILDEELETLYKELDFHKLLPLLAEDISKEKKQMIYTFRDNSSAEEFEQFVRVFLRTERLPDIPEGGTV